MRDQDLSSREPASPAEPTRDEPGFAENTDRPNSTGRRQFLKKAALASAPVILTVASRPAWGHVCAPSGMCSGNASDATAGTEAECVVGYGPNEYQSGLATWPGSVSETAYFNVVFGVDTMTGLQPDAKLRKVIGNANQPVQYGPFERGAVAALLNAASGLMPYLGPDPVGTVICMVHDVLANGSYVAAPNCAWDQQQVLDYFLLTFYGPWV